MRAGPAKSAARLRILLAEDHNTVLEGIRMILEAQPDMEVIGTAGDGHAVVSSVQTLNPDLVVMDVSMPRMNGLKATEALKERHPGVKVLVLTRHGAPAYVRQLLIAGASGYVLKQSRASELLNAIRAVASGGTYIDPAVAGELVADHPRRLAPTAAREIPQLSNRESEVLRLIASGFSNKEIAARLELSVKTIETHKANAMSKLGMRSRIEIVRFALLQGWLDDV